MHAERSLLAVSWEMPPMYGPRGTQVARVLGQLATLGWRPTIICMDPRPGGPHWFAGDASDLPGGVEFVRVPSPEEWLAVRALWRIAPGLRDFPDSTRVWVRRAVRAALERASARRFAGLVTFAQPWSDHLIGARVHRISGLPWVAHFSDPWSDSPYATPRQRSIWRRMEEDVIRQADALVFVSDETADLVMAKYPREWRARASVVPHGFLPARVEDRRNSTDRNRPLRLTYTGRFYDGVRTPVSLLRALSDLHQRSSLTGAVEVLFVGPDVDRYQRDAASLGIGPLVQFRGRVPAAEAMQAAADSDVLLVIDAPSNGPNVFLPSKLIDYLPLRKPIFGMTPPQGPTAQLLRRLECPVAPPEDVGEIARTIAGLIDCWHGGRLSVGESFDRVAAEYTISRTAGLLESVLVRTFNL